MIKIEIGHTEADDTQVSPAQQPQPTTMSNAIFFGKGYSLENAVADAHDRLKAYIRRMTAAEPEGPRDTH